MILNIKYGKPTSFSKIFIRLNLVYWPFIYRLYKLLMKEIHIIKIACYYNKNINRINFFFHNFQNFVAVVII